MKMMTFVRRLEVFQFSPSHREFPRLYRRRNIPGLLPRSNQGMAGQRCLFHFALRATCSRPRPGKTKLSRRRGGGKRQPSPLTLDYVATIATSVREEKRGGQVSGGHRANAPNPLPVLPPIDTAPLHHAPDNVRKSFPNLCRTKMRPTLISAPTHRRLA